VARIALTIPRIGLVMEEVRVTRWLKSAGDDLTAGEPLLEVESEKSVVEIEAAASGRLAEILVPEDQTAKVGDPIAWVETDAESASVPTPEAAPEEPARTHVQPQVATSPQRLDRRVLSSPVARRFAAEHGIDLHGLAGSGPRGRVQLADVERALAGRVQRAVGDASSSGLAPMRRALARAMTLSNATVPQFTVGRAVDWTTAQTLLSQFNAVREPGAPRFSLNDVLLQAVARTLIEMPAMNATFAGDVNAADARIVPAQGAHIGLVVAVENGVLVPVIHGVEQLSLAEIVRRRVECVERASTGRLKRDELEGATFSISNLGSRGPDRFTAMINPPESAILAVGRRRDCVVATPAGIEVRPLSELTLTLDHRVADGRLGAEFLTRLVEILEGRDWNP
jgi:pyruvate dehydrogenase E2 component (dihydrolipoyllysine-residue acetyltransferase)